MEKSQMALKGYRDYHNTINYAKMEARKEWNMRIVKTCLEKGISLETISELTQLSIDVIKKIIEESKEK